MGEAFIIALFMTILVAAITGVSFWQGVGVFVVMFIFASIYINNVYENK